jgi:YSIRK-targeted surface antigen transcriptional regulator
MKNIDFNYLCHIMANLFGMPTRIYEKEKLIHYYSVVSLPKDPMLIYKDEIWRIDANVSYYVTKHFNYYGIINYGEYKLIVGPSRQTPHNDQELRELAFRADVPEQEVGAFIAGIKEMNRMPLDSILQALCAINYLFSEEKLNLKDVVVYEEAQLSQKKYVYGNDPEFTLPKTYSSYEVEQTLCNIVRKGDTLALQEMCDSIAAVNGGILASDQLRQIKNTFIVTATLVSRAAILGGIPTIEAYSLSDAYVQKCELLYSTAQIVNLQYKMVCDFTKQVEQIRFGKNVSQLTLNVCHYVLHHLSETITVEEIAEKLYISRPYLSKKFKQDTGISLTQFILKEKMEEAKTLIKQRDKSINMIASYLGFSSQSHFSRVFKKCTGLTPGEYE